MERARGAARGASMPASDHASRIARHVTSTSHLRIALEQLAFDAALRNRSLSIESSLPARRIGTLRRSALPTLVDAAPFDLPACLRRRASHQAGLNRRTLPHTWRRDPRKLLLRCRHLNDGHRSGRWRLNSRLSGRLLRRLAALRPSLRLPAAVETLEQIDEPCRQQQRDTDSQREETRDRQDFGEVQHDAPLSWSHARRRALTQPMNTIGRPRRSNRPIATEIVSMTPSPTSRWRSTFQARRIAPQAAESPTDSLSCATRQIHWAVFPSLSGVFHP